MTRSHMSLTIKLAAALHALGIDPTAVDWHHEPPLGMRSVNSDTGDTIPPQLDPKHIVPMTRADHKAVTFGNATPLSGHLAQIAKLKRVARKTEEFRQKVLAKTTPADVAPAQRRRARAIPSRPFQKRKPA